MGWDELFHDLIVTSERGYRDYWVGYFFLAKGHQLTLFSKLLLLSITSCCKLSLL